MTRLVGYVRVGAGTSDNGQAAATLTQAGVARVFHGPDQAGWTNCLAFLRGGDTLVVVSAEHVSSSLNRIVSVVAGLRARGVGFRSLTEPALCAGPDEQTDSTAVFVALDNLRGGLKSRSTRSGMEAAVAAGRRPGRPTVMNVERTEIAVELRRQNRSIAHIAGVLGVSASAVQRALRTLYTAGSSSN